MSKQTKERPFYMTMCAVAAFMFWVVALVNPQGSVDIGAYAVTVYGLGIIASFVLFTFGFGFWAYATICARRAHAAKIAASASPAAAAPDKAAQVTP